jgi:hypothetical protein
VLRAKGRTKDQARDPPFSEIWIGVIGVGLGIAVEKEGNDEDLDGRARSLWRGELHDAMAGRCQVIGRRISADGCSTASFWFNCIRKMYFNLS